MAYAMDAAIENASKAIDTSGVGPNTAAGLQLGMSLAQRQQEIEQKRQQMEFQKQQIEMQKGDWLHSQMSSISAENDPKIRSALVDNMAESYPKMFDGRRMDPSQQELMKKSQPWIDKIGALARIRKAYAENDPKGVLDLDKETVNGMSSSDISTNWNHLNTMQQNETAIVKALIAKGVAPKQAEAITGQSQEQTQETMNKNNPMMARVTSQQTVQAQQTVNKDTLMNAYKMRLDGASRVNDLIKDAEAGKVKTNAAFLGQLNAEIARLETGSQSPGLGAAEKTELLSAKSSFEKIKERFTGKPEDSVSPDIIKQVRGTMDSMTNSYMGAVNDRYSTLSSGLTDIQKPVIKQKWDADIQNYTKRFGHWAPGVSQQAAATTPIQPGQSSSDTQAAPKRSQAEMEQIDQQARERLRQVRAAKAANLPVSFTEQQVKETYKNLTGKDLD